MKICILHGSADLYGASRVLIDEVKTLVRLGHSPVVLVPSDGNLVATVRAIEGAAIVVEPTLTVLRRSRPRDLLHVPSLPREATNADLVVLWTMALLPYLPALRAARKPMYVSVHELLYGRAGSVLAGTLRYGGFPIQACSFAVRDWLAARGVDPRRIFVTYPIFNIAEAPYAHAYHRFDTASPMRVAVVGRINGQKGHLEVSRAFMACTALGPDDTLHLFGDPYPGQELHLTRLLEETAHDKRVQYRGHVPDMGVLRGFTLLACFPKRPEPFGLVPIEAWEQGVMTAGYSDGGAREVLSLVGGVALRRGWDESKEINAALDRQLLATQAASFASSHDRLARALAPGVREKRVGDILGEAASRVGPNW